MNHARSIPFFNPTRIFKMHNGHTPPIAALKSYRRANASPLNIFPFLFNVLYHKKNLTFQNYIAFRNPARKFRHRVRLKHDTANS